MTIGLGPHGTGKLRLVRPGVLLHFCPGCGEGHTIDIHAISRDGHANGWDGDISAPTIGEPLRVEKDGRVCEYILRAGVLYYMSNCWHPLAGQSRHLIEFPL